MNILLPAVFRISIITYFHHTKYISSQPQSPGSTSPKIKRNKGQLVNVVYLCCSSKNSSGVKANIFVLLNVMATEIIFLTGVESD